MFEKPIYAIRKLFIPRNICRYFVALIIIILISACTPVVQEAIVVDPPVNEEPIEPSHSPDPIVPAEFVDVRYAQQALKEIGYKVAVDGLWGPRSAAAIRAFEADQSLQSANGHLSELNLYHLERLSGISRASFGKITISSPTGINAKLDKKIALKAAPQLIIVDHEYTVYSKPNPYSSKLFTLVAGTGIYVISKQDDYFEIESINRKRGFIKAD